MDPAIHPFLVQKWRQTFIFLDTNKDGVINESDMVAIAENICKNTGATEEQAEKSRQEWVQWIPILQPDPSQPLDEEAFVKGHISLYSKDLESYRTLVISTARDIFDRVDFDGDGLISRDELDIFYEAVGRTNKALTKVAFDHIDENGDGFIQRDELFKDIVRHFCNPDPVEGKSYFFLNL